MFPTATAAIGKKDLKSVL